MQQDLDQPLQAVHYVQPSQSRLFALASVKNATASEKSRRSANTMKLAKSNGCSVELPLSTSSRDGADCPMMTVDDSS